MEYYASFGDREWQRLEGPSIGSIEFTIACHALNAYLPAEGRILDLGAGPGRHTIWLAQQGYRVVLADLSTEMLSLARSKIEQAGVGNHVEAIVEADACDLGIWDDGAFDAVLSLGPFYLCRLREIVPGLREKPIASCDQEAVHFSH